ncbi:TRAP transporter small permease [Paracoccus pantotrophus]|uniref:TRAP transporter small permease protein n=1 Tax=Paracoccus pantotrophus TaxID=82367 RepID=A0A7H9BPH1_PARPN|nr:TRAP transporter small permease [Paracoccus pantotrophus]QLH12996.1 TRAP transporter small permease [Paracoccus pantotrophus]
MIAIDVALRKLAGTTLGGAHEIAGFIFAVATAFAYPYVLLDRANIRIDVAYNFARPSIRAVLDVIAMIAIFAFVFMLTRSVYDLASASWASNRMSVGVARVPLWIPQGLWVLGYLLFAATAAFLTVHATVGLARRDWTLVNRVAGVPTIDEMIEEETHIEALQNDAGDAANARKDDR